MSIRYRTRGLSAALTPATCATGAAGLAAQTVTGVVTDATIRRTPDGARVTFTDTGMVADVGSQAVLTTTGVVLRVRRMKGE